MFRTSLLILIVLLFAFPAVAADHYILDGGSGDGSAWNNALDDLPASFTRGDTYYVGVGTYGPHTFSTALSGTTPIYVTRASVANHGTDTGWSSAYADSVAEFTNAGSVFTISTGYWEFDGVKGGGPGEWTINHGFKVSQTSTTGTARGINAENGSASMNGLVFKHIEIEGPGEDYTGSGSGIAQDGIRLVTLYPYTVGATVSYCYIHEFIRILVQLRQCVNCVFEYNDIGIRHTIDMSVHGEAFDIGGPAASSSIIRWNRLHDIMGTSFIAYSDSDVTSDTGVQGGWDVYGNVFWQSSTNYYTSNGAVGNDNGSTQTDTLVYNNTFVDLYNGSAEATQNPAFWYDNAGASADTSNYFINNVCINTDDPNFGIPTVSRSYNLYDESAEASADTVGGQYYTSGTSLFTSYAGDDYSLAEATDAGATLSSPHDTDILGTTRGADGVWDRGAYEFDSGYRVYRKAFGGGSSSGSFK